MAIAMRRADLFTLVLLAYGASCADRQPAQTCPVPVETGQQDLYSDSLRGVDMVIVVDNSGSMKEEQKILATGVFTLINSLVHPTNGDSAWTFPAVDDLRVAVVTTDMGLQCGGQDTPQELQKNGYCPNSGPRGDDGIFKSDSLQGTISVTPDVIACDESGLQCPTGWSCANLDARKIGFCQPPDPKNGSIFCSNLNALYAETKPSEMNPKLPEQVACLAVRGQAGCGIEQQLEAGMRAVSRGDQRSFVREDYLLAVIVVSDEEDCSIKSDGLFETKEFNDPKLKNTACALPLSNQQFLYSASEYKERLDAIKGRPGQVVFAAIAGLPNEAESPCQGQGDALAGCLDRPEMQYTTRVADDGILLGPACVRSEKIDGVDTLVTDAVPGRRYVEAAQAFGSKGYVYSICNPDWSPAMREIAQVIASALGNSCYSKPLSWNPVTQTADCDLAVKIEVAKGAQPSCPQELGPQDAAMLELTTDSQTGKQYVFCPLPKIAAPLGCSEAEEKIALAGDKATGWYYCEESRENTEQTCADGLDNDEVNGVDCADASCKSCRACGGSGSGCSCRFKVELTEAMRQAVSGRHVVVQCLQQFMFEDDNCKEHSSAACNDDLDNDGNGVADCTATSTRRADPSCCSLETDKSGRCIVLQETAQTCPNSSPEEPPASCDSMAQILGCIPSWR